MGERVLAGGGKGGGGEDGTGVVACVTPKSRRIEPRVGVGVTGFRETWEEGEGDGIAQCILRGYMRGPEDIWLRCNASGTYTWENE